MSGDGQGVGAEPDVPFTEPVSPEGSGPSGIVERNDDVPKKTLELLGDYLSSVTKDSRFGNRFPLKGGSVDVSTQGPDGSPSPLEYGGSGAEQVFVGADEPMVGMSSYSDSGIGVEVKPLSDVLLKGQGKGASTAVDGHALLRSVQAGASGLDTSGHLPDAPTVEETPLFKRTSSVLALNRFTAGAAFSQRSNDFVTRQTKFGVHERDATVVTLDQLSKVGKSLGLRATGEFKARTAGADPDDPSVTTSALLPGEAQLAITRISTADLEAGEVFRELFGGDIGGRLESDFDTSQDTFGSMTNASEPFDSLTPLGMIALAVSLILAAQIALRALLAVIALITGGKTGKSDLLATDAIGRPFLGDYRLNNQASGGFLPIPVPPKLLGLQDVNFEYNRAVNAGIAVFFGAPRDPLGALVDAINPFGGETFKRAAESPGYYAVFVRNISRSLNTIANTVKNTSFSLNPITVVEGVGNIIDTIRRSKVIAVLNIFAVLGERVLTLEAQGFRVEDIVKGNNKISRVDLLPDNQASHVAKGRKSLSLQLAWRNSSTTSKMLLPVQPIVASLVMAKKGGVTPFGYASMQPSDTGEQKIAMTSGRIDPASVRQLEAQLDAEYVPFYFHDLRTNEIVSFHAFLDSLSDEYQANYESTDAYGRIDAVQTYRSTNRQIGLTFFCVATSYSDMDEMWVKVNKLTTLVYPQFTPGSLVKDDQGNSFVQPFSQVIGGSPLIRLRLGDLFRSNYSRFNLARLFGLGTDSFKVNGESLAGADSNIETLLGAAKSAVARFTEGAFVQGDVIKLRPNGSPAASDGTSGYAPAVEEPGLGSAIVSAIGLPTDDPIPPLVVTYPVKAEIVDSKTVNVGSVAISRFVVKLIEDDLSTATDASKPNYIVNFSDIIVDDEVLAAAVENSGASFDRTTTESEKFFDSQNNVVVRSFENTGGKGLAGVITSLGFDWMTGPWETERYGARAPKMLKVTLQFTPIHDIAPGIDSSGFNRAPIYNVGTAMNSVAGDGPDEESKGRQSFNAVHRDFTTTANRRGG